MAGRTHRPGVTSQGTANDLAELGNGYAANGESEHSRRAARPDRYVTFARLIEKVQSNERRDHLIRRHSRALANLRGDIMVAKRNDPARVAKLEKNLEIKQRFVDRLRSEKSS
jgi:hypothetical protein